MVRISVIYDLSIPECCCSAPRIGLFEASLAAFVIGRRMVTIAPIRPLSSSPRWPFMLGTIIRRGGINSTEIIDLSTNCKIVDTYYRITVDKHDVNPIHEVCSV